MMTPRERIDAVFNGEEPDRMPWYGDLTYWYSAHAEEGDLPPEWQGAGGLERMHRDCGVGEYIPGACAHHTEEGDKVRVDFSEERGIRTRSWHTPAGMLSERQEYSKTSRSWGFTEHAIKTADDLKVLRYIMEKRKYIPSPEDIARVDREYGDNGIPVLAVPGTPITELNKTWTGLMEMTYMLLDEAEEVEKTLDCIAESQQEVMRIAAENPCPYVMICENLSGETMGGYYDQYIAGQLREWTDLFHRHNKKVMIHIDGTLRGVLEKVADTGIDAVDAVTPQPVGDVAVADLRTLSGPDIILSGGLPGAIFAPPFTARELENQIREIAQHHKDSGKFIFGIADQIPPDGSIEMLKMVGKLVEEYGTY